MITESLDVQGPNKKSREEYLGLVNQFGSEFAILLDTPIDEILKIPNVKLNGSRNKRLCNNINVCFS